jgi:integrase
MRWQDLDLTSGVWMVPATWSKIDERWRSSHEHRGGYFSVAKRPSRSPWVWPSAEAKRACRIRRNHGERSKRQTYEKRSPDVRRTLGSSLAKSGAAATVISKALGHVSPQSAKAYVHLDVEPVRLAIEKALGGLGDAP